MLSEKESPWKKSKNGSHRFYPTTEIEPAEDSIFYIDSNVVLELASFSVQNYEPSFAISWFLWHSRALFTGHVLVLIGHVLILIGHALGSCPSLTWEKRVLKGRVPVERSVHSNIVLTNQSRCQEKPVGSNNIIKLSILMWQRHDVLNIFMTWILKCNVHHI